MKRYEKQTIQHLTWLALIIVLLLAPASAL